MSDAVLRKVNLTGAYLSDTNLSSADLSEADLSQVTLVQANLQKARLCRCRVYGISVWDTILEGSEQSNLIITSEEQPAITTDNLRIAQFLYLLLHNEEIRGVIDTISAKVVLILGRFTPKRKRVLDAIRDELRRHDYLPVLLDF